MRFALTVFVLHPSVKKNFRRLFTFKKGVVIVFSETRRFTMEMQIIYVPTFNMITYVTFLHYLYLQKYSLHEIYKNVCVCSLYNKEHVPLKSLTIKSFILRGNPLIAFCLNLLYRYMYTFL